MSVDLYDCDPKIIRKKEIIEIFIKNLCSDILKVKRTGKPVMLRYGKEHLKGYSFMQLIEVSSIIGHFSEERQSAHIDIFSCRNFDKKIVSRFCLSFFNAKKVHSIKSVRQ